MVMMRCYRTSSFLAYLYMYLFIVLKLNTVKSYFGLKTKKLLRTCLNRAILAE